MPRRFPPPWTVERIPGGYVVKDATGQSLAYVYARETERDAQIANVLTMDEARRVASSIAKPERSDGIKKNFDPTARASDPHTNVSRCPTWNVDDLDSELCIRGDEAAAPRSHIIPSEDPSACSPSLVPAD